MGRLVGFNKEKVSYDYRGMLIAFGDSHYTYNLNGIRDSKNDIRFALSGNKILAEITENGQIRIKYEYVMEKLIGFEYNNSKYFYERNIQGDILKIYREEDATLVAEYVYDAWGNHEVINYTEDKIGNINPFRYRGYYYDTETGFYYCNSRYYNPEWGRWITPDSIEYLEPESINGLNLYAYCGNNPVMYVDPTGHFLISTAIAVGFWIGLGVGAIAGATAGGIIAYNTAKKHGSEGWALFGWTILGILGGGVAGAGIGAALGSAIGYGVGLLWGTAPVAGSNGAVALWSGGKGLAGKAAADFAGKTSAKLVTDTFAGKTLSFASHFIPKALSNYLWGQLSAEFVAGAASATIFLYRAGIAANSTFYSYELWVLLEKGIERVIEYIF